LSGIRVVLVDLPPLLTEVLTGVVRDFAVVSTTDQEGLRDYLDRHETDVVIVRADGDKLPGEARRALERRAALRVVALVDEAQAAILGSIEVRTSRLEELSKFSLAEAILGADGREVTR
jgi:DNA-binding NarL/FixJ family response regulator